MKKAIEIYKSSDNEVQLKVTLENETVWLTQKQIGELFNRDYKTVSKHIGNVFREKELDKDSTVAKFATVQIEGNREVAREIEYYNLDLIISVGYREKSPRGTQFRIWATKLLKEHLVKGYTINQKRLEQLQQTIQLISNSGKDDLTLKEAKGMLDTIANYTQSFIVLNQYDSNSLISEKMNENITYEIKYKEVLTSIAA